MGGIPFPKTIRLPAEAYRDRERVFHVVISAMPDTRPFRRRRLGDAIWELVRNEEHRGAILPIAACLMPDHLHVVARPGGRSLQRWAHDFKSYSTRVGWEHGGSTALWQPDWWDHWLRGAREIENAINYVTRNPIAGGLVDEIEHWPWVWISPALDPR